MVYIGILDNQKTLHELTKSVAFKEGLYRSLFIVAGRFALATLTASLFLGAFIPLLWTQFFWIHARTARNPNKRLRSFVSLEYFLRSYLFYRAQLEPPREKMQKVFRDIYVQLQCDSDKAGDNWANRELEKLKNEPEMFHTVEATNGAKALARLKHAAGCGKSQFQNHVPLIIHLEYFKDETKKDEIKTAAVEALRESLHHVDRTFCEEHFLSGSFVFLISVAADSKALQQEIIAFYDTTGKGRKYLLSVLVPTPPTERSQPPAPPALYLSEIELTNLQCFRKLRLDFQPDGTTQLRTTVIGDNALGKSTLLRSLAIALCNEGDAIALMKATPGPMIRHGKDRAVIKVKMSDPSEESGRQYPTITKTITRTPDGSETLRQETDPEREFPWNKIFLSGYGTQRTAASTQSFERYSIRNAVSTLFDDQAVLQNPEVVLLRKRPFLRELLKKKLLDVMLLETEDAAIEETDSGLRVHGPWGSSSLKSLSDGYRSTTQWLLDLLSWLILHNRLPAADDPAGVLLIDEIEQHLHPRWQRHIVQRISRQFPKLQLVVTTHTPLVASGMADVPFGGVISLRRGLDDEVEAEVVIQSRLQGKRADQVLTEFFGLAITRNPGSSDYLSRYVALSSKSELSSDEERELLELRELLEPIFQFGENDIQNEVLEAVNAALETMLEKKPSVEFTVEAKRQLRELFPETGE